MHLSIYLILRKFMLLTQAIEAAIDDCISHHILEDFFWERRMEVIKMMELDYTWEAREPMIRAEEFKEGCKEGREEGVGLLSALFQKLFAAGRIEDAEKAASDKDFLEELFKEFGIKDKEQYEDKEQYKDEEHNITQAVEAAIDDCMSNHILEDFFRQRRAEIVEVMQLEYILEEKEKMIREEEFENGRKEGCAEGISVLSTLFQKLFAAGRTEDAEKAANDKSYREQLFKEFGMKS